MMTKPTTLFDQGYYNFTEFVNPIKDTTILLKIFEKNSFERNFIMFLNEIYQIKIINMTFYEMKMNKEVYSLDLLSIINRDIPKSNCPTMKSDCDLTGN